MVTRLNGPMDDPSEAVQAYVRALEAGDVDRSYQIYNDNAGLQPRMYAAFREWVAIGGPDRTERREQAGLWQDEGREA